MRINKRLYLLTLFLILCSNLYSFDHPDSVVIEGKLIDSAYEGGIFKCTVIAEGAPLDGQMLYNHLFTAKITQSKFRLALPTETDWFNVIFAINDKNGDEHLFTYGNVTEVTYLMNKADRLRLLIRSDGFLDFSGIGATKLTCQQNIYSLGILPVGANAAINDLYNDQNYAAANQSELNLFRTQLALKRQILDIYAERIPSDIYRRIWWDALGQVYGKLFYSLSYVTPNQTSTQRIADKVFLRQLVNTLPIPDTTDAALLSTQYTNNLLLKEIALFRLGLNGDSTRKLNFLAIRDMIKGNYPGKLRDKLIFLCYLNLAKTKEDIALARIDMDSMKSGNTKALFTLWRKSMVAGTPAYAFKLPDEKGKFFTLDDFHGKVIIADFWFTGCRGCIQMPAAMEPVYKRFAKDERVQFLSINVDNSVKWWKYGLAEKKYTIPGAIHLSLYQEGREPEMLRYYNYESFPQLLIIDRNGNTNSVYAPDPRADKGEGLISLINGLLK